MNGDKKKVQFTDGKISTTNLPFRRKTESLDWKKVASIDVEKVIQSSNLEILEELLSQITYCRAETEFDSESTDSGLLKVFKLSQLIIESLLHSQEILQERYDKISSLYAEVEEQKTAYAREIQSLKENLQAAKKELKRRKEIIASTQSEVIGDNKDEFDPCPYCNKKFLTSAYLISHMQRRHQGLPIHPIFPSQNIFPGFTPTKYKDNSTEVLKQFDTGKGSQLYSPRQKSNNYASSKYIVHHQSQDTQTHKAEVEKLISLETIGALVDQCLKQKEKLLKADTLQNQTNNNTPSDSASKDETSRDNRSTVEQNVPLVDNPDTKIIEKETSSSTSHKHDEKSDPHETVVKISEEIKNQLDLQWKSLLQKIQESGLGELNKHLITDSSEPGEIESKNVTPSRGKSKEKASFVCKSSVSSENEDETCNKNKNEQKKESTKIPETKIILEPVVSPIIHINLEERLQKQQDELENLKSNLQSRMHEDKLNIESKLESQERYWQNKLRMVEKKYLDEYSGQLAKLREEFHQSLQKLVEKTSVEPSPRIESKVIIMADQNKQFHNDKRNNNVHSLNTNSEKILGHMTQKNEDDEHFQVDDQLSTALQNMAIRMSHTDSSFQSPQSTLKPLSKYQQQDEENYPDHNLSIELSYSPSKQRSSSLKKFEDQNPSQVRVDQQYQQKELEISKPVAKPRKTSTLQSSSSPFLSKIVRTDSKHDNQNKLVKARLQDEHQHHEYEEPKDIVKLDRVMDYSESESVSDSDENQNEDQVHSQEESKNEETEDEESVKLKKQVIPHGVRRHSTNSSNSSKFTIRMLTEDQAALEKRQKMREQCEKELSDQLMSLGYEGCETEQINTKDKNKVLKKLKQRRESIKGLDDVKYSQVRERIQEEAEIGALSKSIKDKLDNSLFTSPIKKSSKSPLVKILSAVKMSKNSWKKSVRSACKRPNKDRKSPVLKIKSPSPQLKIKSKPSLFSKARWSKQKKKQKDNNETIITVTTPQRELEKSTAQVTHSNNSSNSVSGSENDDDDDDDEEVTRSHSSTGESRNSEPEIEKTIFVSKKPIMTSTPSNKSTLVKESQRRLHKKKKHWDNKHKDGVMTIQTDDDDGDSDENSLEYEIDEKDDQSEQGSPLPSSPNVLKKRLKVKNNKASKLRYREAARKSAAAAIHSKEEKEKTQMNNNGFNPKGFTNPVYGNAEMSPRRTLNKNPNQNVTTEYKEKTLVKYDEIHQKSVRRSLEPQFDKFTPHPTPNLHDDNKKDKRVDSFNSESESSASSSSSSSSWDDDDGPKKQALKNIPNEKLAGEYASTTPTKYSNTNYNYQNFASTSPNTTTKELRNSIQSTNDGTKNFPLSIRPFSEASTSQQPQNKNNYSYGNNNQKTNILNRPQTSKRSPRVALDSWDDDLMMSDGENQVEKVQRESPNHNNKIPFDKKRPMSMQTNKTTKQQRSPSHNDNDNYKKSSTKVKEHPITTTTTGKDSPLNNSWDDD